MKPNVYFLNVCKLFKDWSLIYMKNTRNYFGNPYFTIQMNLKGSISYFFEKKIKWKTL